jgi:hypothetical protein
MSYTHFWLVAPLLIASMCTSDDAISPLVDECCTFNGCGGVCSGDPFCNTDQSKCEANCQGKWCTVPTGHLGCCTWNRCDNCVTSNQWCDANQATCEGDCNGKWCPHIIDTPSQPPTIPSSPSQPPTIPSSPSQPPTIPSSPSQPPTIPSSPSQPPTNPSSPSQPPTNPSSPSQPPTNPSSPSQPPTNPSSPSQPPTNQGLGPNPVILHDAKDYAILAKAGVTNVPESAITGDIGVSPISRSSITGFNLVADISGGFATSSQVTGKLYAADDISPTSYKLSTAVLHMQAAHVDANGRPADFIEYQSGALGGSTLVPGVYKFATSVGISGTDCTISGTHDDRWIFQIAGNLNIASAKNVILAGGAKAENIVWVVAGAVTVGVRAHFEGIILGATSAHFLTQSSINGRVLVQTAVTLQKTTIVAPA